MARVAAYIRRSTPGEDDKNYSLDSQLKDITSWAEREGHELVNTFSDPGGKSDTLDRPALNKLFEASRRHEFDVVAVWRFDRFSRSQEEAIIAAYMLKQQSVRVVSITQPLPEGPLGTMMMSMHNFASELELSGIRERINTGKRARVQSGKLPPISHPKYGYQFDGPKKERYILHPETAPIVQRIFADYVAGKTVRAIAQSLTGEGVPTPAQILRREGWSATSIRAVPTWHSSTIFNLLRDTSYIGRMVGYKAKYITMEVAHPLTGEMRTVRRKTVRAKSDEARHEYGPEVCPPIVSEELFTAAQERMTQNKEQASRNTKHPATLLLRAGLAKCGYCGHVMVPGWNSVDNQHRYVCSFKVHFPQDCPAPKTFTIRATELDTYAWNWFVEQLSDPAKIASAFDRYLAKADTLKAQVHSELAARQAALAEAQNEEDEYVKAVGRASSDAMRDRFVGQAEDAHSRADKLLMDIEKMEREMSAERQDEMLMRALQTSAPQALKRLQSADIQDRREAMYHCKVEVTVWGRGHEPAYEATWLTNYVHSQL